MMQDLVEFKDVESEEDRRSAFEKHIKRMKVSLIHGRADNQEKLEDAAEAEAESSRRKAKREEDDPMDGGKSRDEARRKDKYRDDRRDKYDRDGGSRRDRDDYRSKDKDRSGKREGRGDRKSSMDVDDREYKVSSLLYNIGSS